MLQWYRNWRERRILSRIRIVDSAWEALLRSVPPVRRYAPAIQQRLRRQAALFLHAKSIEPANGLVLTEGMRHLIALQACLPVLGLHLDWYRGWHSIIVYPGDFRVQDQWIDDDGIAHEYDEVRAGEAWPEGPVILSWEGEDWDAQVVMHEFAHKLDMANGVANGMPPLHANMSRQAWTDAFTHAWDDFLERVETGTALPFDGYAATDPAEFFAVVSEVFLLSPGSLRASYPQVYAQLCLFYRQDPAAGALLESA